MKKILLVVAVLSILMVSGCRNNEARVMISGMGNWEYTTTNLYMGDGYEFEDYKKDYVGDACIVTVKFIKVK